jgi:hypothetical protein
MKLNIMPTARRAAKAATAVALLALSVAGCGQQQAQNLPGPPHATVTAAQNSAGPIVVAAPAPPANLPPGQQAQIRQSMQEAQNQANAFRAAAIAHAAAGNRPH